MTTWKHKKTGGEYELIAETELQTPAGITLTDHDKVVIYKNVKTGQLWVRDIESFYDGRFEKQKWEPSEEEIFGAMTMQGLRWK